MCAIDAPTYADGTCNGDSGGPLLAQRADGTWIEIGITNSGAADCSTGVPNFFARADALSAVGGERPIQQAAATFGTVSSGHHPAARAVAACRRRPWRRL